MKGDKKDPADLPLPELVSGIVADAEELIGQQIDLLRSEVLQEIRQAKAGSGILSTMMLVHLLHKSTRIPLWGCYGLVGGLLGVIGTGLLYSGEKEVADVQLMPPPQTAQALKENIEWVKEQATPGQK
jgi:hypothetical protein